VIFGKVDSIHVTNKHVVAGKGYVGNVVLGISDESATLKDVSLQSTIHALDSSSRQKNYLCFIFEE